MKTQPTQTQRFSKETLAQNLIDKLDGISIVWNFDPQNGPAQVLNKSEHAKIAYGRFSAFQDLLEELGYSYSWERKQA